MTNRAGKGGFQDWGHLRDHAIQAFGETPHPATEQDIIDAYELHPDAVERAVAAVAHDVKSGNVRSGWGVLRTRATQITTPVANPTRETSLDREKAIARAETWMRNAGLHYDNKGELLLELFDTGKLLHPYAQVELEGAPGEGWQLSPIRGDVALTERMLTLYRELRPLGIKTDQEALERAAKWNEQHTAPHPAEADLPA